MQEVQGEVLFKNSRPTYQDIDALRVFVRAGVVVGVRLQKDGVELRAPQIVSCAGLIPTYTRLVPIDETEPVIVAGWN